MDHGPNLQSNVNKVRKANCKAKKTKQKTVYERKKTRKTVKLSQRYNLQRLYLYLRKLEKRKPTRTKQQ